MNILVLNCGSSSLKFRLITLPKEIELVSGEAQRIGSPTAECSSLTFKTDDTVITDELAMKTHADAFKEIVTRLGESPPFSFDAIGHRVVHGGNRFTTPLVINQKVLQELEQLRSLAPIHNPPAIDLIRSCTERSAGIDQVAVFDTAFHSSIPEWATTYAIPARLRKKLGIRKYGFHGTSHRYVVEEAAHFLGIPLEKMNAVSCHLGSGGASLCAVAGGKSIDNTMGMTPLQGLVMSTRCGDVDPSLTLRLMAQSMGDNDAVEHQLNRMSGILGLSGFTGDIRDVLSHLDDKNKNQARLKRTADIYLWRLRKYLGAYLTIVGQADALIFTDTIGERVPQVRWAMCREMACFGLSIDAAKNQRSTPAPRDVSKDNSRIRILIIETNEELAIARQVYVKLMEALR